MKLKNFILFGALCSVLSLFASCEEVEHLGLPRITISTDEMTFDIDGGEQELTITTTRAWKVETDADWVVVSPESGAPALNSETVTVTALRNDGMNREAKLKVTIGMISKYLTVQQAGPQGSADALIVYGNDFDKEKATQGTSGWPYLDSNASLWDNKKGTGADAVTYEFGGKMSVRTSGKLSNDASGYSHYAGSGMNKVFFGAATSIIKIMNIALPGTSNYTLSFGGQKYLQGSDSNFSFDEFKVYLSNDGSKWTPVTMAFPAGSDIDGDWNLATADITLPAGTSTLHMAFVSTASSAYSLDDVLLSLSEVAGQAIDFTAGVEIGGTTGGTTGGGNSGSTSGSTAPANAIFYESFATSKGNFTLNEVNVPSGLTAVWEYSSSYTCMKATGYVNATTENLASESWLISPEIDLTSQTAAYLTFEHAGGYFGTASEEATLWISKNGGEWTQLTIAAADYPTSWSFVSAGNWDLKSYLGSKIKVAFKYKSTTAKAGTWEIRNVAVIAGTVQVAPEPVVPDVPTGENIVITTNSSLTWTSDSHATYGEGFTTTSNGVKMAFYKHKSTTALSVDNQFKSDHTRIYKGSALVITLENGKPFKYIAIKATGSDYSKPFTVVSGAGTVTQNGTELIWSGDHASPFVAELTGGQIRMKEITIVY